ncbi:MAG: TlpA family protein disulfide reductase [Chthoniobacterales bacterium]|nr:TlpA family protein disulfide reductase [Chthoniobacterales bacterium]
MRKLFPLLVLLSLLSPLPAADESADSAWVRIEALRKGPGAPPEDAPEKAVQLARSHLAAQEKALSEFVARFPSDPRRFEAEIELAGVTSSLGASLSDRRRVESSLQRLSALERSDSVPSKVRADAAFQRITTTMQTVNLAAAARPGETANARNTILDAAGNFASRYPEDRRAARLLAEAATLLDDQPSRKRKILEQAATLARDDGTRQRIQDDLKRLELLGRAPDVGFETIQGGKFQVAAQRGRVTALAFWASWSPPSVVWLSEFAAFARTLPAGRVSIATVSLDRQTSHCRGTLEKLGITDWPTACAGRGWEDPTARQLGINALPTLFVFDAEGRLRALNARGNYEQTIRDLVTEKPGVRR